MFRLSQLIREIKCPTPVGPHRNPPGPVVVWNLVRRCNLTCKHCYSFSADTNYSGELSLPEVFKVMEDLRAFRVPVLILSGGEPLLRPDIFTIARKAKEMGFYTALSSNGTLIDKEKAKEIAAIGFEYVGVSIDGIEQTHDEFRRRPGCYAEALNGIRLCRELGVKVGLRFTLTQENAHDLPGILELMEKEDISKFYLSHLNYAGRGNSNRKTDAYHQTTRQAMELLFKTAWNNLEKGQEREFVTGNNDADGVFLLKWVKENFPDKLEHLRGKLVQWGGNASGVNVANIGNTGDVHPDTMWWHYKIGNVKERPFSEIWMDVSDPLMKGLKEHPRKVGGRCGTCPHLSICNGNTRVRAHQVSGDFWAEDPGCYLSDEELAGV